MAVRIVYGFKEVDVDEEDTHVATRRRNGCDSGLEQTQAHAPVGKVCQPVMLGDVLKLSLLVPELRNIVQQEGDPFRVRIYANLKPFMYHRTEPREGHRLLRSD